MKILLTHSDPELPSRESIDLWRIIRPFRELSKHVDWQIDHQSYLVDHTLISKKTGKVPTEKLVKELDRLGSYDIIWTSYFPDAVLFDAMMFMSRKYGTKFVLDVDDDMFNVPKSNPIWKTKDIKKNLPQLQYCIENTPYLVTSSEILHHAYQRRRGNPTLLFPNYIGQGYKHKPFDNGDKVVISFFGSVSHEADLVETGFLEALKLIMKKYKHVHAGSVGLEVKGLPKNRYTFHPGKPGQAWIDEVWPHINCDVAVAPLIDTHFNRCKTNIKWLETAMIPAAFIGSNIPPYKGTVRPNVDGFLVNNTVDSWYKALEDVAINKLLRLKLAMNAHEAVEQSWSIENNWDKLQTLVETIQRDESATIPE